MRNATTQPNNGRRLTMLACASIGICLAFSGCARTPEAKEARYLESGKKLLEKKDYARALIQFRNAAKVMPKDAEPYYQAGLVYLERRDWQAAYQSFKGAVQLNPKHQQAQLKLAEIMAMGGKKEVEQAHQAIQDLIKTA